MGDKQDGKPVPRDLPDQQAGSGQDPWEAADSRRAQEDRRYDGGLPDTDEAGTGPRGAPRSASAHPENPVPDEPSA